jgi:hypothetical protein
MIRDNQNEQRILALKVEADNLRTTNLLLEEILNPRRIGFEAFIPIENKYPGAWNEQLRELDTYAGTIVVVHCVMDLEATRFAQDIAAFLNRRGWKVSLVKESLDSSLSVPDGVAILYSETLSSPSVQQAVWQLGTFLDSEEIKSKSDAVSTPPTHPPWWPKEFTPTPSPGDTLAVFVGMKPIEDEISDIRWIEQLSGRARKFFEELRGLSQ